MDVTIQFTMNIYCNKMKKELFKLTILAKSEEEAKE